MKPLLSEATYARLCGIADEYDALGSDRAGSVHLPAGATDGSAPRVLFVGQALRPENRTTTNAFANAMEGNRCWLPHLITNRKIPFWRFIARTMEAALTSNGASTAGDVLLQHLGWSNLALIANPETTPSGKPNPVGTLLRMQMGACADALREAVDTMRPTAVVLLVGTYADECWSIVGDGLGVPSGTWTRVDDTLPMLEVFTRPDGLRIFWTHHPGYLNRKGWLDTVSSSLARELR